MNILGNIEPRNVEINKDERFVEKFSNFTLIVNFILKFFAVNFIFNILSFDQFFLFFYFNHMLTRKVAWLITCNVKFIKKIQIVTQVKK